MYDEKYEEHYWDAMEDDFASETFIQGLLDELTNREERLTEANSALREARAKFDVEARSYAVIRDILTEHLGHSLYAHSEYSMKSQRLAYFELDKKRARFRFIQMEVGEAVLAALQEVDKPLTLEEIVQRLQSGGMHRRYESLIRAVNAALIRTSGIMKTEDGKYALQVKP